MDNANIFPVLPSPTVHPREPIGGYFSYKPDVIGRRREEVQILRPPDFGVGHDAVPQYEPPGSPPLAVIGPLVEHPGHRALRSPRITGGSAWKPRRQAPRPPQRRRCGSVPHTPAGTLQRYAAQRMHFLHSHFGNTKNKNKNCRLTLGFPLHSTDSYSYS
jgi:hypothetical protein